MAGEWAYIRLGDCCRKIGSGATPRGGSEVYLASGPYTLIRSQNIYNDGFHHDGLAYIGEQHAARLENVEVLEDDVLLNITGDSVARACQVDSGVLPARVNQHVAIIRPDPEKLSPRFLRYFIVSPDMQTKLLSWAGSGGTRNALTKGMIESFEVFAPVDVNEQRAIAHILGTLDDKIELNRRMSETLEAMARVLFKSWFVDFEPVRAKAEGRWRKGESLPGLPAHLFDLFPDSFVDSELGEIPKGWEEGSFGSFVSQWSERAGTREVVVLSAIADGKLTRSDDYFTKRVYSKEIDKYLVVRQWDFAYNPSRINIGSIGMLTEDILGGVSPVYIVVRPVSTYRWFLEFTIKQSQTKVWIHTLASGSVRQSLSYADFASIPCVVPPETVAEEFSRNWIMLREGILSLEVESITLTSLRDALLPKLISGDIRIPDAERFIERTS
jgi:type I restriction enzyme, S subunit